MPLGFHLNPPSAFCSTPLSAESLACFPSLNSTEAGFFLLSSRFSFFLPWLTHLRVIHKKQGIASTGVCCETISVKPVCFLGGPSLEGGHRRGQEHPGQRYPCAQVHVLTMGWGGGRAQGTTDRTEDLRSAIPGSGGRPAALHGPRSRQSSSLAPPAPSIRCLPHCVYLTGTWRSHQRPTARAQHLPGVTL